MGVDETSSEDGLAASLFLEVEEAACLRVGREEDEAKGSRSSSRRAEVEAGGGGGRREESSRGRARFV